MNSHLHIGLNNVIGKAVKALGKCLVVNHDYDFNDFNDFKYLSLSAFDPSLKLKYTNNYKLIEKIIKNSNKNIKVLYISSCRVFDDPQQKFLMYKKNKLNEVNLLREYFLDVNVIYLPNIVGTQCTKFQNNFLKIFLSNLNNDHVTFDVSRKSRWNFVTDIDVAKIVSKPKSWRNNFMLLSKHYTKISDFHLAAEKKHNNINIQFNDNFIKYPKNKHYEMIETEEDLGKSINWILKLMENTEDKNE